MPWDYTLRERVLRGAVVSGVTPTSRLLFCVMWASRHKDPAKPVDYGTCDSAESWLARKVGCHVRTVKRLLPTLVQVGLIGRPFTAGPEARWTRVRNRYTFPDRRSAPFRPVWRRGPTRQQLRDAERAAAKAEKLARSAPRHGDVRALGAVLATSGDAPAQVVAIVAKLPLVSSLSMGGKATPLALESQGAGASRAAVPGPERTSAGAVPRGSPPGVFPHALSDRLIALAGKRNGGGRPPPE